MMKEECLALKRIWILSFYSLIFSLVLRERDRHRSDKKIILLNPTHKNKSSLVAYLYISLHEGKNKGGKWKDINSFKTAS